MKKSIVFCIILLLFPNAMISTGSSQIEKISGIVDANDSFDLVIISSNFFSSALQPLVEYKNNQAVKTLFKATEDIYNEYEGRDNAEQIKYFIRDAIETFQTKFVLFIGGTNVVPTRYTHIYYSGDFGYPTPTQWVFPSDFYYADIYDENGTFSSWDSNNNDIFAEYAWDGNYDRVDFKPDVYIGRLPCNNENELAICIQKICNYETTQAWSQEWFRRIICVGGDSLPRDTENIDEGEYVQQHVIDILQGFTPERIWVSNGNLRTSSDINEAIHKGAGFVFFNGHGNHDLWATHLHNSDSWIPSGFYRLDDIDALDNNDKLPIVISDACYHCQYDTYDNCFAWSMVRNPTGGAIAFIGGSDTDLAYPGTAIIQKGIERLCIEMSHEYMENCSFLGPLIGNAIRRYTDDEMNEIDMITVLQNHLFGDPSLRISGGSQPPLTPEPPRGVTFGEINVNYSYTVETVDPDGDQIYYMWDWGDETLFTWTGPYNSGQTAAASHVWSAKGIYSIKVKAKDTTGSESPWSNPLPITMPYSYNKPILQVLELFFQRFPNAFPLLQHLLYY
jgi:hypothetical protein